MTGSSHHQAINKVGDGYKVTMRSADGTIEGIENKDGTVICVQFHPERDRGEIKGKFFNEFIGRANTWREGHDPLSAEELANLMKPAPATRFAISAEAPQPTTSRREALSLGLADLDKTGWELATWRGVVSDRNLDEAGGRCEIRGRKSHKLAMSSETERERDEMLLSLTDEGVKHLPKEAQDVLNLMGQARDVYGAKTGDLFSAGYNRRIGNPIEAVWAFRKGDLMFTPPNANDTRIRSLSELQDTLERAAARKSSSSSGSGSSSYFSR
jgi:hypothetical protein